MDRTEMAYMRGDWIEGEWAYHIIDAQTNTTLDTRPDRESAWERLQEVRDELWETYLVSITFDSRVRLGYV